MDLDKKTEKELQKMIVEKKESLRGFRFGTSGSKTKDVKVGTNTKKDIARILTELRKKEIAENNK
ncbi:50S ribosomal protein L29 [Candidatus Campbellbacteria bacterium RIFCSPHIGHO2_12_FULL_35_10]|uniref:Large ribosomal subunit protein uL29 n=1 Tax=Candidatus Campbellbacteria bacterium RIFCSPHIGHO2_12_FULL_35_10 TaxID=1797578 RepID=A0A1F5ELY5_9BACT|nr:MAG: 50S ribosomal protein L29 [Candidatus Campbellbacteria bacterium RIFCSPHIGHO2_12_FULL_35_10]